MYDRNSFFPLVLVTGLSIGVSGTFFSLLKQKKLLTDFVFFLI